MSMTATIFRKIGGLLTGEKPDGRRTNFFVEKEFQKSFIFFFVVMITFMVIISGGAYYLMLHTVLEQNIYTIHPKFTSLRDVLTPNLILFFVEVTLIAFVIIVIAVDRILSRVSKSLMTYERIAERLTMLEFKKAQAIEADHFPNLHRQYADLIDKYSADISQLKEKMSRIKLLIELLEERNGTPKEKKTLAMTELIELKGAVESKLKEYKLDDLVKKSL